MELSSGNFCKKRNVASSNCLTSDVKQFVKQLRGREGQSLVDILIGIVLLIISINAAVVLVFGGQSTLTNRENATQARALAREGLEAANFILKENWDGTADGIYGLSFSTSTGRWQWSGSEDRNSIFTRKISIKSLNGNEKSVSSTVSWTYNPLKLESVEFVTLVTNWKITKATGGDTGGGGVSGNWQNPRVLSSINLGAGISANDLDVINKIIFMAAQSSDVKKPDFFIVDATNNQNPIIKSSIDVGSGGLNAVDAAANYAYAANQQTNAQLLVIDVSNILNPTTTASFQLPGVSGSGAIGNAIFYYSNKIYIGTKKATGPEFHIIDVSNPTNPVSLGSLEINGDVNDIYVKDNLAYIAISPDDELRILDVTNPANIRQVGNYNAPGNSEDGRAVQIVGSKLYLGRLLGGNHADHHEFHILDVSSSSLPQNLGSKDIGADVNDLRIRDNLAFLATADSNKELQVWDISSPANITPWGSLNFPQIATGIDYEDNVVYVSVRSNDALRIITSQ
jgi:hypothetical protein